MIAEAQTPDSGQPEPQIPNLTVVPGDIPTPEPCPLPPAMLAAAMPQKKKSKPKGKIAELPQNQRDLINHLFDDGATYKSVKEEMAKLGVSLNGENLSNWFNGPYQDYVRDREWREELLSLLESGSNLGELTTNGQKFQETIIQLAFVDIFRALKDPTTRTDPLNHIRTLNALARLNREALSLRKYNDLRAEEATTKPSGPTHAPTAQEICNSFLVGFETVHGIKPADAPIGPDLNDYPTESASASASCSSSSSSSSSNSEPDPKLAPETPETKNNPPLTDPLTHSPTHSPSTPPLQNSTTPPLPSPPELCYSCSVPLPPLKPDGTRPSHTCPGCHIRLYPPGTTFDHCPICDAFQPILPDGERNSSACERCHQTLPPPGQRYLAQCPGCGIQLKNFDMHGNRIVERCRNCLTPLPLLEPIPDPNQNSKIENQKSLESPPLATAA